MRTARTVPVYVISITGVGYCVSFILSRSFHNLRSINEFRLHTFCFYYERHTGADAAKNSKTIMKRFLFFLITVSVMTGCAEQRLIYRESSGRNIEPAQSAVITPLVANLELISENKIAPYVEILPYAITPELIGNVNNFKKIALLNAAKKYNADTLVAALINVETTDEGYLKITVTGYPAKYTGFRTMTEKDIWLISAYGTLSASNAEDAGNTEQTQTPRRFNIFKQ